jgi:proteasome lid subunit RPN8/RPN11
MEIAICGTILAQMMDHALSEDPLECCGLLSGRGKLIDGITRATNQKESRTEFSIAPEELLAFMKKVRKESKEFLGIYHSHPGKTAVPSERDVAEFYYPDVSYWVVATRGAAPEVRCYQFSGGQFERLPYRVAHPERGVFRHE